MSAAATPMQERGVAEVLETALGRLEGMKAVDLGCGAGPGARGLARLGAAALGLDPNVDAIAAARAQPAPAVGATSFDIAPAEATGLGDSAVEVVLFLDSLHHAEAPDRALAEAHRILTPGGRLAVFEPEPGDATARIAAPIVDETRELKAAAEALEAAVVAGAFRRITTERFRGRWRLGRGGPAALADAVAEQLLAVDPRRPDTPERRATIAARIATLAETDDDGAYAPSARRFELFERL